MYNKVIETRTAAQRPHRKDRTMEKKFTITLTEREVRAILLAAIALKHDASREARETTDNDLRECRERTAKMWAEIHDDIKSQKNAQQEG